MKELLDLIKQYLLKEAAALNQIKDINKPKQGRKTA